MISLVEGADRSKTPNEIALTVLLAVLTEVFLIVIATLSPVANDGDAAFLRSHDAGIIAGGGLEHRR